MDDLPYHIVIPAAGKSSRFLGAGFGGPKGLLRFKWRGVTATMIEHVLQVPLHGLPVVVCRFEDLALFQAALPHIKLVSLTYSMGQADTAGHAIERIPRREDILIVNCDNAFECTDFAVRPVLDDFVYACRERSVNCGAMVFRSNGEPRYGYVDAAPEFFYGKEKVAISPFALAGAFYFVNPAVYEHAYRQMLIDASSNASMAEQYISGMFRHVGSPKLAWLIERSVLHEWGTPEDLEADPTVELMK